MPARASKCQVAFQALFWCTFAVAIGIHFWIGDVVTASKIDAGRYFFELREHKGNWQETTPFLYWANRGKSLVTLAICIAAAFLGLRWWLAKED